MRLIDADALIKQCINGIDNEFIDIVKKAPTIKIEYPKRGKWIKRVINGGNICEYVTYYCSECQCMNDTNKTPYCQICGAKMECDNS